MLMEGHHIWVMQRGGVEKEEVLGTVPPNPQYNPNSTTVLLPL